MEENRFVLLLVDDEADIISSIRRVFRNKEYEILTACNGGDALQIVKDRCVDAAIIDLLMPGIHGLELLTAIKKENSSIAVVILTAFGLVGEAVNAMKLGAADFFEKPVQNEKLLSMIEQRRAPYCHDR
jgi:DNA-binding NtrC family response regulator